MMRLFSILVGVISSWATLCASEMTATSKDKVNASELIAIGRITSVDLGPIREWEGYFGRRQQVKIGFEIEKVLLGGTTSEIVVNGYSTSYVEDDAANASTAGFSAYGIKPGQKYLVFLVGGKGHYKLASDSNQYFEHIKEAENLIEADGQNAEYVPFDKKVKRIAALAAQKQKAQPAHPPNPIPSGTPTAKAPGPPDSRGR
jgi:hypothetical protein